MWDTWPTQAILSGWWVGPNMPSGKPSSAQTKPGESLLTGLLLALQLGRHAAPTMAYSDPCVPCVAEAADDLVTSLLSAF